MTLRMHFICIFAFLSSPSFYLFSCFSILLQIFLIISVCLLPIICLSLNRYNIYTYNFNIYNCLSLGTLEEVLSRGTPGPTGPHTTALGSSSPTTRSARPSIGRQPFFQMYRTRWQVFRKYKYFENVVFYVFKKSVIFISICIWSGLFLFGFLKLFYLVKILR